MKHPSTRALFDYWNERRGNRPAPERADIDPAAIRHALGDTFMLAADFVDELRFRLAGTRVCALFCREIKGEAFPALWSEESRKGIEDLLTIVTNETLGAVAGLTGRTADGSEADLEILLLPLAHLGHARIRALVTYDRAGGQVLRNRILMRQSSLRLLRFEFVRPRAVRFVKSGWTHRTTRQPADLGSS